jgi:AcrR family transcriptional regulator
MQEKLVETLVFGPKEAEMKAPVRKRLAPQVRVPQILDAALVEFAERGFTAARMDDIAGRCGLSKGGLYAHFQSKDQIFKALLGRLLAPPAWQDLPPPAASAGPRALAQWITDGLYAALGQPASLAALRLLVAESARVEALVGLWERTVVQPQVAFLGETVAAYLVRDDREPSVLVREPWLVVAPIAHALLSQMIFGAGGMDHLERCRQGHIDLLCELLEPRWRADAPH